MKIEIKRCAAALAMMMLATLCTWAQEIAGRVTDRNTGEPLIGATIQITGTQTGTVTDVDGHFRLTGLERGRKYSLTVQYVSYETLQIDAVAAGSGAANEELQIQLKPDEQQIGEVTVTAVQRTNTDAAMVQAARRSPVIVSNISAQEIKRTQDSNAGEVIRRVPGVSLIDDKFVMVRGLAQRYNNVWINGGAVPSSEPDSRAFSFDMIPSSQIDNMMIVKSPSAEYPADYTGGFIMVNTKELPPANALNIQIGGSWNSGTAFRNFLSQKSSPTDFLGFDSGLRSLSGGIDAELKSLGLNSGGNNMIDLADNGLNNDWRVRSGKPAGDLKIGADWSSVWNIDGRKLGLTSALNYANEYRAYRGMLNNFYGAYDTDHDRVNPLRLSTDDQYNHNVRLGVMLNLTLLSRNGRSKYELKNIFNQIGNSRYTWRDGLSAQSEPERSAEYYYRSRTTYSAQLTGKHTLGSSNALDWSAAYAYANNRLPDRKKYILYNEDPEQSDQYVWLYQNDISREWTSLNENIVSAQLNDEHTFSLGSWQPKLKGGIYAEYRDRDYKTRNFFYWYNTGNNTLPQGFRSMDMAELLSESQYYGADRLYLLEQVNKINDYSGRNTLAAGYLLVTLPLGRLDVRGGVRYEYNDMELISNTRQNETSHLSHHYRHHDLFPSLNLTYRAAETHQLRLSYGRSVNRPEFREVSPSVYYDFDLASDVQGNFDLRNCYVDNIDLRYEWYPSRGESVSVAAFYKHFDSPIEWVYTMSGGTDVIYSYENAKAANNYGLELDVRKSLAFIGLPQLSWSFNGALIHSRVKFPAGSSHYNRAMQGQSPYLINTGLFYKNERLQLDVNLLYNRIGKRIVGVGRTMGSGEQSSVRVPDSYEMPRDAFDLTASKRFGTHVELRLSVRDLLNQSIRYIQTARATVGGESRKVEQVTRRYKPGRNVGLTLIWTL